VKTILSVDPGKVTGMSLLEWSEVREESPKKLFSWELDANEFADMLQENLSSWSSSNLVVVCERFTINAQTIRNSQSPFSLEQIGVLKYLCRVNGISPESIILQSPADAKSMFPNEALKKLEIWHKGGEGHANDSLRHALLRLVKMGWKPVHLLH